MSKGVYSLVLQENVVDAIDRLAYLRGVSRSALINQILAETVGYVTPERRMAEILETLSSQMTGYYQLQGQTADGSLVIRSPLRYRYKPTIRYRMDLYRQPNQAIGVLHAFIRTQNQELLDESECFFRCWTEHETVAENINPSDSNTDKGQWNRIFRMKGTENFSNTEIGEAIGQYIKRVDSALKAYFAALPNREAAQNAVADFFR